ncbi:MAG: CZB domain-containing protein [Phycisphaerales bacterium]|nr:MAG: CZB domain-containing protein [Phycisphaerales bacterium]
MAFDFNTAKMKHFKWKMRLRDFLDGKPGLTTAEATSHKDCDLGKWLYSEGLAKYGTILEMRKLEKEHEMLHKTIKSIVDLKSTGKTKEAEDEFKKIEPLSKSIVDLLTSVESKASKMAA